MTCIAALAVPETGTILMGGDTRRGMNGGVFTQLPVSASKVFEFSGFVVGHTGAGRIRNITSRLTVPFGAKGVSASFDLENELLSWMVKELKRIAKEAGSLREKDGVPDLEGEVLIAFGNQMCLLGGDFGVTPITTEYWAIGSGQRLALGSLFSTGLMKEFMSPKQRLHTALLAAATFDSAVAPPFVIKETTAIPGRNILT